MSFRTPTVRVVEIWRMRMWMRADGGGTARRARPAERAPVADDQRQLSGAWRSERLREHARGEPTRSGRGRARGRVMVGRAGEVGKWAARALRRAKAPSDHWRIAAIAAAAPRFAIVAVESSAEAAGWARRRQQQRRTTEAGRSRKAFRVLDEEPEEGDTR